MTVHDPAQGPVRIREVEDGDLEAFFEHQQDPVAMRMAAFPARDREAFMAHAAKIRADETVVINTIEVDGRVAGNVLSWEQSGKRAVGYWIDRRDWGRGIATAALSLFVGWETTRPLYAHVAVANVGSIRVLEKCGFSRLPADDPEASTVGEDGIEEILLVLGPAGHPGLLRV
jgi:RimJ/RimL family protein N-acetyltransferase